MSPLSHVNVSQCPETDASDARQEAGRMHDAMQGNVAQKSGGVVRLGGDDCMTHDGVSSCSKRPYIDLAVDTKHAQKTAAKVSPPTSAGFFP